ncbi:MAG: hypothetical protein GY913_17550 [Proteobacteria bacterium]|nr:hypothetical protein [Pseudomonadota bacterium]MCP4918713.1 hypothetical protein [Pseudomonadota bacterium]
MLFLLACGGGRVAIDSERPPLVVDTGELVDSGDTGTAASPFAGSYVGVVGTRVPAWSWDLCQGAFELTVSDEGFLTGEGLCEHLGDGTDYRIEATGAVADDGYLLGTASFLSLDGFLDGTLEGRAVDDTIQAGWRFELVFRGEDAPQSVEGFMELER